MKRYFWQEKRVDFEFWRQERARVLSKPFNEYREDIEIGNYLAAIDTILEFGEIEVMEATLQDDTGPKPSLTADIERETP